MDKPCGFCGVNVYGPAKSHWNGNYHIFFCHGTLCYTRWRIRVLRKELKVVLLLAKRGL
jgi:hypothetical protein